jgi:uncharacterized repeat protein (TIGR01451 family)
VQLLDALPAGLGLDPTNTRQLSGPDVFINNSAGSTAQFTAATMGVQNVDVFVVAFQAGTTLTQGQMLTDTASVSQTSSRTFDPNSGNDSSSFTSTVTAPADLSLTGTCPPTITAGGQTTYTITVANLGPCAAQNATLTDVLPTGQLTLVSATADANNPDTFVNNSSGNTVRFTGTMGVGNRDTFVVVATADSGLANGSTVTVTPTAAVDPTKNIDPNPANNSMPCTSTIPTVADLAVGQVQAQAKEGDTFSYTISVSNAGPSDAQNVMVMDTVPAGLRLISGTLGSSTVTVNGNQITFSLGTPLKAGTTATGTVVVQALEDGNPTNTVTASTTTTDPNSGNIRSDQSTPVAEGDITVSAVGNLSTQSQFSTLTNVPVATFTHANGVEAAGHFSTTIDWGDGGTSMGSVTQAGMTYTVTGTHTYNRSGSHNISVTVSDEGHSAVATTGTASVQQQGVTTSVSVPKDQLFFLVLEVGGVVGAGVFDQTQNRFVELSFGFMPGLSAPFGFTIPLGGGVLASSLATLFGGALGNTLPSLDQTSSLAGVLGANTSGPGVLTIGTANGQPVLVSVIPDASGTSIQYLVQSANGFLVLGIQKLDSNGNDLVTLAVSTVGPKGAVTKSSAGFFHNMPL